MKLSKITLGFVVVASFLAYSYKTDNIFKLNPTDQEFVIKASQGNLAEVSAGKLAAAKAMNDSIKMFGQMMVSDHSTAQNSLDSVAGMINMETPDAPDTMHQAMAMQLQNLSGNSFDSAYINGQVTDHQNTITLFQNEIQNGENQMLKDYAKMLLPKIQHHYEMAVRLSKNMGDSGANNPR